MMSFFEIFFLLPVWDLIEEETDGNCAEIVKICDALNIRMPDDFVCKTYESFYEVEKATYYGDPNARTGRGNVIVVFANESEDIFLLFDMYNGRTDQSNMVGFGIRCEAADLETIQSEALKLYAKGIPRSDCQQGRLNLKERIDKRIYPKEINDCGALVKQEIEYFRNHRRLSADFFS